MADDTERNAATLESTSHIPIAQLTPLLTAPFSRSVKAVVTLTWPYSSATRSVAFLLAEPDFRLRRTRGQVRVQFSGSSAKTVAKSGIASGDEVILCLDGVEFIYDEATVSTPGRGVEFELRFSERLLLQFRQEDAQEVTLIDIDHPSPEAELTAPTIIPTTPELEQSLLSTTTNGTPARPGIKLAADEFSSPAFIKRARTSYGSLFEDDLDLEDGTIKGKGRKRTRLSSTWRYASRSPTPEMEVSESSSHSFAIEPVVKPIMTDEGVQTIGLDDDAAQTLAGFARQSTDIGRDSYTRANGTAAKSGDATPHQNGIRPTLAIDFSENVGYQPPVTSQQPHFPPHLQHLTSESLPLTSPFVSHGFGVLSDQAGFAEVPIKSQSSQEQISTLSVSVPPPVDEGHEDIYSASPAGRREEHQPPDLHGFQSPDVGIGIPDPEAGYPSEDQYPRLQSENALLHQVLSPHNHHADEEHDRFRAESQDEDSYNSHGLPISPGQTENVQQYPDLDDVLAGNQPSSAGGQESTSFSYPELPDHGDNLDSLVRTLSQSHSAAMSRSISVQSAVVDLTESSDEEDEGNGNPQEVGVDDEQDRRIQQSDGSIQEEDYDDEEQPVDAVRSGQFAHKQTKIDAQSETSQEADYYSEDEVDEDGNPYPPLSNVAEEEGFYSEDEVDEDGNSYPSGIYRGQDGHVEDTDEEGSYDEDDDMEDDEAPTHPRVQHDPVVIDLLSSDDEEEDTRMPKTTPPVHQQMKPGNYESEDSAADGSDSDFDGDVDDEGIERHIERPNLLNSKANVFAKISDKDNHKDKFSDTVEDGSDDDRVELRGDTAISQEKDGPEDHDSASSREDEESVSKTKAELAVSDQVGHDEDPEAEEEAQNQDIAIAQEPSEVEDGSSDKENAGVSAEQLLGGKAQDEPSLFARVFSLDGANDEPESGQHEGTQSSSEMAPERSDKLVEAQPRKQLQDRPSLFSRMFNLDGANDEPEEEISYPALPDVDLSPPETTPGSQKASQNTWDQDHELKNAQLPTPDATQSSQKQVSQELTDFPIIEPGLMDEGRTGATIENTPGPETEGFGTEVDIVETIQTTSITEETARVTIEEGKHDKAEPSSMEEVVTEQFTATTQTPKPSQAKLIPDKSVFTAESPRRSHRRVKSTTTAVSTEEDARPVTPVKSIKGPSSVGNDYGSPMVAVDKYSTSKGYDASIELALSSLDSPSKHHDLRSPPMTDLKLRLTRNLRTELEEFTALKVLRYHLNQKLDVLAITTTTPPEPQRAKGGPRNYLITFNITDPSIAPSGVTEVQVFRPYKEALPIVKAGDGILLRNFQVISVKNRGFALRSEIEASSWAVFKDSDEPEVRGPPVEYGSSEKNHVTQMKVWYNHLDATSHAKLSRANADKVAGARAGIADRKSIGKAF